MGASLGTASGSAGTRYVRQPFCGGEKSGPISLFPDVSYSRKNSVTLIAGGCCLLFTPCFYRLADFVLIKVNLIFGR